MSDHHADPTLTMIAVATGALVSRVSHLLGGLPPGIVGPLTTLLGGALLHLLAPMIRARGERLHAWSLRRRVPSRALSRSVLVIDDHDGMRSALALYLRGVLDVPVHEARSGAEGRGMAQRYAPAAIVCDLALPDEDGDAVLRAIGRPGAVLMSGAAHEDDLRAAAARCDAVAMAKPLDEAALVAAVRSALAGAA